MIVGGIIIKVPGPSVGAGVGGGGLTTTHTSGSILSVSISLLFRELRLSSFSDSKFCFTFGL